MDLRATVKDSTHHVQITCAKCDSLIVMNNEIRQITTVGIICDQLPSGINPKGEGSKTIRLVCKNCEAIVGVLENETAYKIFKLNVMNKNSREPLIKWTGTQDNHVFQKQKMEKKTDDSSLDKLAKTIAEYDPSTLSDQALHELEVAKREEFANTFIFKFDRSRGDLEDGVFESKLEQYADKKAQEKWNLYSDLLKKEFKGNPKFFKKLTQITCAHILRDMESQPAFQTLINASDELIRERIFSKLIPNYSPDVKYPAVREEKELLTEKYAGECIIYVDLSKANFNAIRLFDPSIVLNYDSWNELVSRESTSELLLNSPRLRHQVFGKINYHLTNVKNIVVKVQYEVLNALYYELLHAQSSVLNEEYDHIFKCSCDELFIKTSKERLNVVFDFVKSQISNSRFAGITHMGSFMLHKCIYDPDIMDGYFYVKQFIHKEENVEYQIQGVMNYTRKFAYKNFATAIDSIAPLPSEFSHR